MYGNSCTAIYIPSQKPYKHSGNYMKSKEKLKSDVSHVSLQMDTSRFSNQQKIRLSAVCRRWGYRENFIKNNDQ